MHRLIGNEIKLLLRSKLARVFMVLTIGISLFGIEAINNSNELSLHGIAKTSYTIAYGITEYGALAGAVLFGILTIITISKDKQKGSQILLDVNINYEYIIIARTLAVTLFAIVTVIAGAILESLVQVMVLGIEYDLQIFLFSYGVVMLPALIFSICLSTGLYLITDSMDISILLFAMLLFGGLTSQNYMFKWVKTHTWVYSDFAGISNLSETMIYNRIFWIFLSVIFIELGMLLRKRSGLNRWESIRKNIKKVYTPIILIVLCIAAGLFYMSEPYVNPKDSVWNIDQPIDNNVSLTHLNSEVILNPKERQMTAKVNYIFNKDSKTKYIDFIMNTGLKIESVRAGVRLNDYEIFGDILRVMVPENEEITVEIIYQGRIKLPHAEAITGYISEESIYLLENSHWIFNPLVSCKDEIKITGMVTAPKDLTVIPVGKVTEVMEENEHKIWHYEAVNTSADIALFAGHYKIDKIQVGDVEIELYYSKNHKAYIDYAQISSYIKDIINYYTETLGEYAYKDLPIKIVETSIYKTGGHSTANVVTISEYMFNREVAIETQESKKFSVDSWLLFHDIEIIAHEIAHQWWGTSVNVKLEKPWSSEGLANYMAYKYFEHNEDMFWHATIIWDSWGKEVKKHEKAYYKDEKSDQNLQTLLYCKMPLLLIEMEQQDTEEIFLAKLAQVYKEYQKKSLSYKEFLNIMEESGQ